jgi:hypothetical protein
MYSLHNWPDIKLDNRRLRHFDRHSFSHCFVNMKTILQVILTAKQGTLREVKKTHTTVPLNTCFRSAKGRQQLPVALNMFMYVCPVLGISDWLWGNTPPQPPLVKGWGRGGGRGRGKVTGFVSNCVNIHC